MRTIYTNNCTHNYVAIDGPDPEGEYVITLAGPSEGSDVVQGYLTFEQATEMHRKLGEALTDERVRRAEAERSKQP